MGIGSTCGQCQGPFKEQCQEVFKCNVHHAECFGCQPCKKQKIQLSSQYSKCSFCPRMCLIDELYYDFNCQKSSCFTHFLKKNYRQQFSQLPCGCIEETVQIQAYLKNTCRCYNCGRKLIETDQQNSNYCGICNDIIRRPTKQQLHSTRSQSLFKSGSADNLYENAKYSSSASRLQTASSNLLVNKATASEMARKSFSRVLFKDSESSCPICLEDFNLEQRVPMLICICQLNICKKCFTEKKALSTCPFCRQPIKKEKVLISRERLKTLELEKNVNTKYDQYLNYLCQKQQAERQLPAVQQKRTLTEQSLLNAPKKKPKQKKVAAKATKSTSLPRLPEKK